MASFQRGRIRMLPLQSKADEQVERTSVPAAAEGDQPVPSRRSFLARAAVASAVAVPTLTLLTSRKARAAGVNKVTRLSAEVDNQSMNDENPHVPIIQNLLDAPDTPLPIPIRQPPSFNLHRLVQPNLQAFLETAAVFENTGTGLYHGALLNVTQTQEYFPTAAGLASVEPR